jgi:hypothetical protein
MIIAKSNNDNNQFGCPHKKYGYCCARDNKNPALIQKRPFRRLL